MVGTATPADLRIQPRNFRFGRGQRRDRAWLGGDPIATAWMNSLSTCFPQGEAFFIESVRRFAADAPKELADQIAAFVKQEVYHTREHVAFNRQLVDSGFSTKAIDERLTDGFRMTRELHPVGQLAVTVALEHFTAIFAHMLLKHEEFLAGAPDEVRRLWQWHSIEEIEHKAVAYDTFMWVTRDMSAWQRWKLRSKIFLSVSVDFLRTRGADAMDLLAQDGIVGRKAYWRMVWYLVGRPGVLRKIMPMWVSFLRPNFHPWDHDDRDLLQATQDKLGLSPELLAA